MNLTKSIILTSVITLALGSSGLAASGVTTKTGYGTDMTKFTGYLYPKQTPYVKPYAYADTVTSRVVAYLSAQVKVYNPDGTTSTSPLNSGYGSWVTTEDVYANTYSTEGVRFEGFHKVTDYTAGTWSATTYYQY